jgi:uncharacterized protein
MIKPMFKVYLLIITIVTLALIFWQPWKKKTTLKKINIEINGHTIEAEIAETPAERAKGLMFREYLKEDSGMLFIFPNSGKHSFWMANTYIPLDILWINAEKQIVHIEENVPPCKETGNIKAICTQYKPTKDAKYVLEVNAGWVKEHNVALNSKIDF